MGGVKPRVGDSSLISQTQFDVLWFFLGHNAFHLIWSRAVCDKWRFYSVESRRHDL